LREVSCVDHTSINQIIIDIMVVFMVIGAVDKALLGNRLGLGEKFDEGFMAMGALALSMVGVISLAPVLADILNPIVGPVYRALGADPAMFATTLLACDMGGYPLAMQMAATPEIGNFAGMILGSMMGPTIVFSIPVALGIIEKSDRQFLAKGTLVGIVTIPIGSFVGGVIQGLPLGVVISNLIPVVIVAALIAVGLWRIPDAMVRGFDWFGKGVIAVITLALAAIIIETLTGIVLIPGMAPLSEGVEVIGAIAIVLAGAFPMVYIITKYCQKPLMSVGKLLGINDVSAAGLVATLANNIPMFTLMKDMDDRGKVINVAFCVSAAFVFGDHLGFCAGVAREMIFPMIIGKLVGGVSAVAVAMLVAPKSGIKA
jgi:ethanolamine transporter